MQSTSPNHPYGSWVIACCRFCHADSGTEPHRPWCRWSLWTRTGADPALIWERRGRVAGSTSRYRARRYKHLDRRAP
jgi:hypothetical protein